MPKSSIGSQLCGSGELWCKIKRDSLLCGIVLRLKSLYFFLGKEVCDGAEYQECAGEANHRPPATAAHQPSGERPSEMLLLCLTLPNKVEFFVHLEAEHSPEACLEPGTCACVSTVKLQCTVFSSLKKPPLLTCTNCPHISLIQRVNF